MTPEQVSNWRRIIAIMLEKRAPGSGIYAMVMPEEEIIALRDKLQSRVNDLPQEKIEVKPKPVKKVCDHSNSIKGSNGRYCLDCEMYV